MRRRRVQREGLDENTPCFGETPPVLQTARGVAHGSLSLSPSQGKPRPTSKGLLGAVEGGRGGGVQGCEDVPF